MNKFKSYQVVVFFLIFTVTSCSGLHLLSNTKRKRKKMAEKVCPKFPTHPQCPHVEGVKFKIGKNSCVPPQDWYKGWREAYTVCQRETDAFGRRISKEKFYNQLDTVSRAYCQTRDILPPLSTDKLIKMQVAYYHYAKEKGLFESEKYHCSGEEEAVVPVHYSRDLLQKVLDDA